MKTYIYTDWILIGNEKNIGNIQNFQNVISLRDKYLTIVKLLNYVT